MAANKRTDKATLTIAGDVIARRIVGEQMEQTGHRTVDPNGVYDLDEVANILHVSTWTARKWVREGRLRAAKLGRRYLVTGAVLLAALTPPDEPPDAPGGK